MQWAYTREYAETLKNGQENCFISGYKAKQTKRFCRSNTTAYRLVI